MVRNWMQRWWRKKAELLNGRWETDGNYMLKDILRFKAWGKESKNMADGKVSCLPNGLLMLCWTHTNMQMYKVSKQSQHKHLYGIKKFCKTNLFFLFYIKIIIGLLHFCQNCNTVYSLTCEPFCVSMVKWSCWDVSQRHIQTFALGLVWPRWSHTY